MNGAGLNLIAALTYEATLAAERLARLIERKKIKKHQIGRKVATAVDCSRLHRKRIVY